jgi:hypothetical protein
VWASVVLCPADFAILACGSLLVLQALGLADGVEKESGESFMLSAGSGRSSFVELSIAQPKRVLVVELVSQPSRGSLRLGSVSVGVRVIGYGYIGVVHLDLQNRIKLVKVTRPGIEPRTFWTYTRCSNQLSYLALKSNQLILYLCNCQPKDTYSARHI